MPVVPDALSSEMAGPGVHDRSVSLLGGASEDELGVLPSTMAKATAARIFAARIVLREGSRRFRRELRANK
jgi:hypothetical protein